MQRTVCHTHHHVWEISPGVKLYQKVPVRIYADSVLLEKMKSDMTLEQGINVGCLPGIYRWSIVLPDALGFSTSLLTPP